MDITYGYYYGGKPKAVTLSYDDGQIFDRRLVEILNKYGVKCTFCLNSSRLDSENFVSRSEIKSLYEGHEIAIHTLTHPTVAYIPNERLANEVIDDRKELEALSGRIISGMSYPNGSFDDNVVETVKNLGIVHSRTTLSTNGFSLPKNFLEWHPTLHHSRGIQKWSPGLQHSHTVLLEKAKEFIDYPEGSRNLPLLYVWGHSYEFEYDNTWDVIENFCEYISQYQDKVWFATNIEIYNYVTALKSLRFSADTTMVYNPSAISVWIGVDGKPVEIKSGETIKLTK